MTVTLNASELDFAHMDRDAARGATNIVPALQAAVNTVANRPQGGTVLIGTPRQAGFYPWEGTVQVPDRVKIVGKGRPRIDVVGATSHMLNVLGDEFSVSGLSVETHGDLNNSVFRLSGQRPTIADVWVTNDSGTPDGSVVQTAANIDDVRVVRVHADRVTRMVWIRDRVNGLWVDECEATHLGLTAIECGVNDFIRDAWITRNRLLLHDENSDAGHMIAFQPGPSIPGGHHRNVHVVDNQVEGIPGVANVPGVANGASGDLIALKNVVGFSILANGVRNSGEIGITAVFGCQNGAIKANVVESTDLAAIAFGGFPTGAGREIVDVAASENVCRAYGADLTGQFAGSPQVLSGIWLGDSFDCGLWDNQLNGAGIGQYGARVQAGAQNVAYGRNASTGNAVADLLVEAGATGTIRETQAALAAGSFSGRWA